MSTQGFPALATALRSFPKTLDRELDDASERIARDATRDIKSSARTRAERKAAGSVRARTGRQPAIQLGAGAGRAALMFPGTEWGGGARPTTQQFRPWRGGTGYFVEPTIKRRFDIWARHWEKGLHTAARKAWR